MRSTRMVELALGAIGICAAVACSSSKGSSSAGSTASAVTTGSSTASAVTSGVSTGSGQSGGSYQLDPAVTSLRINADVASIDLTAQDDVRAISVRERLHGEATTTKEVSGSSATLTAKCPAGINFGAECSVTYTVTMPARIALTIDGAAGDVTVTGPLISATISTNAGRVEGTALGAGTYQVRTNAGKVNLTFAKPPDSVKVKTDIGQVTLTVPGSTKYAVTADTTVGSQDVQVDRDPSSPHRIDVSTSVGSITINKG